MSHKPKHVINLDNDFFMKSARNGLVAKEVFVTRNGKTFRTTRWVKPDKKTTAKKQKLVVEDKKKSVKLEDTSKKHKKDGKYTEERMILHRQIVDDLVKSCSIPAKGKKPQVVLMGGGSASGKSTMKNNLIDSKLSESGVIAGTIDSDEIKKSIPEFSQYKEVDPSQAAFKVHNESSDIGAMALNKLIEEGRQFVFDGTMKSESKYNNIIDRLNEAGYDIHVYVADVPLDVALERNRIRAEKTGRLVPEEVVRASHEGVPKTLNSIKDKVTSYQVFDTSTRGELKLFATEGYTDQERYKSFLDKGNVKVE